MVDRFQQLKDWLAAIEPEVAGDPVPVSGDASFRHYYRVMRGKGPLIVMDAPPDKESCREFLEVARFLKAAGVHAPEVFGANLETGFVLLEDFGDLDYLQALDGRRAETLYQAAIDAIVRYQVFAKQQAPAVPPYTADLFHREMMLFVDWLVCTHLNISLTKQLERLIYPVFEMLIENAMAQPQVFVHRDFHSRNLMVTHSGDPGVLDFQDAVIGPITYDLVSLLKDCYIAWPRDKVIHWACMYRQRAASVGLDVGQTETKFLEWFDRMGVQRHLKASGIFARLWHRDGKRGYLADIPRTLRYIVEVGEYDQAVKPLADLISEEVLPALAQVKPARGGAN